MGWGDGRGDSKPVAKRVKGLCTICNQIAQSRVTEARWCIVVADENVEGLTRKGAVLKCREATLVERVTKEVLEPRRGRKRRHPGVVAPTGGVFGRGP